MDAKRIRELESQLGEGRVFTDAETLASRRYDQWVVKHLRDWLGQPIASPGCVVRPRSTEEVARVVRFAAANGVPVTPFGLGSGVCGGIEPTDATLILDLSAMNRVREIDPRDLLASFDAGVNGLEAERAAEAMGLTIGHWPQSIALSSVGGWVSTRASGQFSTAYGNIEDIVYAIEAVTPYGEIVTLGKAPRAAAGPDLRHLLIGAEGALGVVTGVTLSLRRAPERRAFSAYHVRDMDAGFGLQREIMQADWRPPVMRQYDAREVRRMFRDQVRGEDGLLILVHEGPATRVEAERAAIAEIARACEADPADPAACEAWMERRNHVPSWRDLLERGFIVDTIEISAPWSRIGGIYARAIADLASLEGVVNASAHSSHAYRSGLNLYFSFAAAAEDPRAFEAIYHECWRRVMDATSEGGGGVAHHHGVGRLRKAYLGRDLGEGGLGLLRRVKSAIDPEGLFNPGVLIDP